MRYRRAEATRLMLDGDAKATDLGHQSPCPFAFQLKPIFFTPTRHRQVNIVQIVTVDEVIFENFLPEIRKVLLRKPRATLYEPTAKMFNDDRSRQSLFVLLYPKTKTKNLNKNYLYYFTLASSDEKNHDLLLSHCGRQRGKPQCCPHALSPVVTVARNRRSK